MAHVWFSKFIRYVDFQVQTVHDGEKSMWLKQYIYHCSTNCTILWAQPILKLVWLYIYILVFEHALERVLKGSSIFWVKINNLHLLQFGILLFPITHTTIKKKKKKKPKGVMNFFKKIWKKKGGQKKQIHCDEVKKRKEYVGWVL